MRRTSWLAFWLATNGTLALVACGSRTGFDDDLDSVADAAGDVFVRPIPDAGRDATFPDVGPDALPLIDSRPTVDVQRNDCPDADATLVYLIGADNRLYSFYPPTLNFAPIGVIACATQANDSPYSMAVDRKGKAYVLFLNGGLFNVSTGTAACAPTGYVSGQLGFDTFGMGFVSDTGGAAETLFVAGSGDPSQGLAAIDTASFRLNFVAPFTPAQSHVEFTGTGDGRLFGFSPKTGASKLIEVDKTNGNILASNPVGAGTEKDAFAFAFWGGDFWIFTGEGATGVYRYRTSDQSTTFMTTAPSLIVGAGVSTCAPQ